MLEVGCGNGLNLEHIHVPELTGIDSYEAVLPAARYRVPRAFIWRGDIRAGLGRDKTEAFDLAISCTVLQHIADDAQCLHAIRELYRVSRKWVLVMEYDAKERMPIEWRGSPEGIVKRPWASLLTGTFTAWGLLEEDDDFDSVSWWLVRK